MHYIGIDIGSTAAKVVVRGDTPLEFVMPTGWSSKETAGIIKARLSEKGIDVEADTSKTIATGYGRVAVDYADKVITEITCHGRGGREMGGENCAVIDVGGQDTKVILLSQGMVQDFLMNDKCSAGTGKFLEIMANRLGVTLSELFDLAAAGEVLPISSLCTVFAESEVINYIGEGRKREDIDAEYFRNGRSGNIRVQNGGTKTSALHGNGHQGSDEGFTHAALSADHADHLFNMGIFI